MQEKLTIQFLSDIIKYLLSDADTPNNPHWDHIEATIEATIEDIWDAPKFWAEYKEFFGDNRDKDKVRRELTQVLVSQGIKIPAESFLNAYK